MRIKFAGKNIDIDLLSERVERFLMDRGFKTLREKIRGGYKILGIRSVCEGKNESVCVKISGNPDKFAVDFESGGVMRTPLWAISLARMVGAGYFVLRDLKSKEMYEKLESEFWAFIDEAVSSPTFSSKHTC